MSKILHSDDPILVVDDERTTLFLVKALLKKSGLHNSIITCQDSRQVQEILSKQPVSVILLDLLMPYIGGEELLARIARDFPEILVIIITGVEEVETAVRCIKMGAFDYVVKPLQRNRLSTTVQNALGFQKIKQENLALRYSIYSPSLKNPEAFAEIITNNSKMISLFRYAESIAFTSEPVLITGETGVGKELIAKAVHTVNDRKGLFVPINVAGLDDSMFSDTLFGHARGAFTGADRVRSGMIEKAKGGTLFLDEIGDLALTSQAKLLRFLQEGDYLPLGQDKPKSSDARIVSATNQNLWALAETNKFRSDLNYRLRTHHIHLPPLRERRDDLQMLVNHFLAQAAKDFDRQKPDIPDELFALLNRYSFPGNIRELRAIVFNALGMSDAKMLSLTPFEMHINRERQEGDDVQQEVVTEAAASSMFSKELPTLDEAMKLLIEEAMRRSNGNQSLAGRMLGISQQAISKRLKKLRS